MLSYGLNKTSLKVISHKRSSVILIFTFLALINLSFSDSDDYFSIIILPDTQYYTSRFHEMIYQQMDWIVQNKNILNIQYVVHMGDITDDNKESAWEVASSAYKILENAGIPYSVVCGDNDIKDPKKNNYDGKRHTELFNKYFPVSRFDKPGSWWKGGFFEPGKIDNYYCLFSYRDYRYMIMNLEIAPRTPVLKWAGSICSRNPSEKVIVVTHDYLDSEGKRLDDLKTFDLNGKDKAGNPKGNNADEVFKKLIKKNQNILMVLCGHKNGTYEKTVKISMDSGKTRKVFEILTDFQDEKMKGSDERSGKGLLRLLKVYPGRNEFVLSTFNAITGKAKEDEIHLSLEK
jgi:hypothetical protein